MVSEIFYTVMDARYQTEESDRAICILATESKKEAIQTAKEYGAGTTVCKCAPGKQMEDIYIV